MEKSLAGDSVPRPKWRKVAYGGKQIGYDDNYTDESFLEEMVMNANVVRRDLFKDMKDSVSISQYLCIVALVVLVWIHTLESSLDENSLLLLDRSLLASGLHVFAVMLFSLQVFLFAPLVTYCIKKFSFGLHLLFSFALMGLTLYSIYALHRLFFLVFLFLVLLVNVVCPYWLIKMQEYKFEINGPWDEAKFCFDITD